MSSYFSKSKVVSRAVAVTMLLTMLSVGIGVPLYPVVARRADAPYPCRDCACACSSATACWSKCCCHTDQEKLAWAEANSITPPAWFRKKMEDKLVACHRSSSGGSCCGKPQEQSSANENSTDPPIQRGILAWNVRQCHGLAQLFMILSSALPVPDHGDWTPELILIDSVVGQSILYSAISHRPEVPPPRCRILAV